MNERMNYVREKEVGSENIRMLFMADPKILSYRSKGDALQNTATMTYVYEGRRREVRGESVLRQASLRMLEGLMNRP